MTHSARSFALASGMVQHVQIGGIAAADLDTRTQLVTKDNLEQLGKRFEI